MLAWHLELRDRYAHRMRKVSAEARRTAPQAFTG
jgi:hypothetical protein